MEVTEEEIQYWRKLRRYGYSYDDIARKSFEKFGLKRSKSSVFKYASDVDEALEDGDIQWTLPRFTVSKRTKLRAAGLVERHDVDLDDVLEQGIDAFELMKDNDMDSQDLLGMRSFLEKLKKKRKGAGVVLWAIYMLNSLEEAGIDLHDVSKLRRILEGILAVNLDNEVIRSLPEILKELSSLNVDITYLLWILRAISEMEDSNLFEDTALLLLKELDLEKRSGKSWEEACNDLSNRVDTKLDLEKATLGAKEELKTLETETLAARKAKTELETDYRLRLQEVEEDLKARIAASDEKKKAIERGTRDAHQKFQETLKELHTAQRALETVRQRLKEAENDVEARTGELDEIARKLDKAKEWLEENGIRVEMGKGFLCLVAGQPQTRRTSLMFFAQAVVNVCRDPASSPRWRDTIDFFSRGFQLQVLEMVGHSTGHMIEFYTLKGQLALAREESKRLKKRIVDLERENAILKTQLRVG